MNKLPKAHKKANKARCDKRRNRQRKLLKAKTKLAMGCLSNSVGMANIACHIQIQLRWYGG